MKDKENLGYMLLASNLIDEVQMKIALEEQKRTARKFGSTLVDLKFIDENVLAAFLSKQIDIPCISLLNIEIPRKVLRRLPAYAAHECQSIPVRMEGDDALVVAMADPTDEGVIEKLTTASGMRIVPLIAPQSSIGAIIDRYYPDRDEHSEDQERTLASMRTMDAPISQASHPIFMDLIEELENADLDGRLTRLEDRLNEIWIILEKILRTIESKETLRDRLTNRHME